MRRCPEESGHGHYTSCLQGVRSPLPSDAGHEVGEEGCDAEEEERGQEECSEGADEAHGEFFGFRARVDESRASFPGGAACEHSIGRCAGGPRGLECIAQGRGPGGCVLPGLLPGGPQAQGGGGPRQGFVRAGVGECVKGARD